MLKFFKERQMSVKGTFILLSEHLASYPTRDLEGPDLWVFEAAM